MQAFSPLPAPPEVLQLAGHPVRWRLLAELARSDRIVSELSERVGEPHNLVSYHLGKLRAGGLVEGRRSAADGRDTYYTADLSRIGRRLSAAGAALHPGLGRDPEPPVPSGLPRARILFLCTGNSVRSQMAEALVRARANGAVEAVSAGSHPKALHPNAVRVMREDFGLDIAGQASKPLSDFAGDDFDVVVSLCDKVREVCPEFPGRPEVIHWSIANPANGEDDDATLPRFRETAAELARRIDFLLAGLADRIPEPRTAGEPDDRSR